MTEPLSDDDLMVAAQVDPDAFGEIYSRYRDAVYRYCRSRVFANEDAADLTQQTFTLALRAAPRYRATEAGFPAWLFTIARNSVIDAHRRRRRTPMLETLPDAVHAVSNDDLQEDVVLREHLSEVRAIVATLARADQDLIALHFTVGLTVPQAARVIGKSESATRMRLWRAMKRIKKEMER